MLHISVKQLSFLPLSNALVLWSRYVKRNKAMNSVLSTKSYAYAELMLSTTIHTLRSKFMGEINTTSTHPIKPVKSPFRSSQSSSLCAATIPSFEQDIHQGKFFAVWESPVVSLDILNLYSFQKNHKLNRHWVFINSYERKRERAHLTGSLTSNSLNGTQAAEVSNAWRFQGMSR